MSRKFRPTSLGSQSGIYSVRGSELARTGVTTPNTIRCVVELLDDSEFVIDVDVSNSCTFLFLCNTAINRCFVNVYLIPQPEP